MAAPRAADIPASLKAIKPFVIIHAQLEKKDPIVSYFVLMYAVREGLATTDPQAKTCLLSFMDKLEAMKRQLSERPEGFPDDIVAQAHVEEYAFKLFDKADADDRASNFSKTVSKLFFTASQIFTSLKQFGELSEEIEGKMKYAKWKAVEIDKCLKSGIVPTPGPPGGNDPSYDSSSAPGPSTAGDPPAAYFNPSQPGPSTTGDPPSGYFNPSQPGQSTAGDPPAAYFNPSQPGSSTVGDSPTAYFPSQPGPSTATIGFGDPSSATTNASYSTPSQPSAASVKPVPRPRAPQEQAAVQLTSADTNKAQKYCKFASSAIEYEDIEGAIEYLTKAMNLLKTGKE